jgi:Na+-translocating ferredoxin:NAD+ oxidoreductase RnfG subunit
MLEARVFAGADEALAGAFPEATLERKAMYLTAEQQSRLEQNASLQRIGRFHTFYIAKKNGAVVGYALFDTHRVRTKEETVLVALNAGGSVREVRIVSFFEPQEYLAPERWLAIFGGKTSRDALQSGRDLPTISGATLTTRAVSTVVRKAVLLYDVHFAGH